MGTKQNNRLDTVIKISPIIISTLAIFIGFHQFNSNQKSLKYIEFKKIYTNDSLKSEQRLIEKKLEVYSKIGESVGAILSLNKLDTNFTNHVSDFEKIYYGEALIIEDTTVNKTMKIFRFSTHDYIGGSISKEQLNEIGMALCDTLKKTIWKKKTAYQNE